MKYIEIEDNNICTRHVMCVEDNNFEEAIITLENMANVYESKPYFPGIYIDFIEYVREVFSNTDIRYNILCMDYTGKIDYPIIVHDTTMEDS